ncbi:TIM barrel protein [Candidatus Poribacteria bacterium]|nr:TIM barrel protein [Candidatus Poribacteria bacterium]
MKLGIVTYNIAKDWDLDTIIEMCENTGMEGVELRTTHAHGVEVELNKEERADVKKKFQDSKIELAGLGSAFDYHSADQDAVRKNIEGTKEYTILAKDVGAPGIKVRPNGFQEEAGIPKEKTLEQIGKSLRECGEFAADYGVQIRLEVHGRGTSYVPNIRKILDIADHENVVACWNSNQGEVEDGSIKQYFDLLAGRIGLVHMRDLVAGYPWGELLCLLKESGYEGFCLGEIPGSPEPERILRYYRAVFDALTGSCC